MSTPSYDVIVIGLGAMGSAALDQLARRGARVLGIERFGIPHEQGSSGGETRLTRKAYYEHPDYVPLLERAYANWESLEARSGERVLYRTGAIYLGAPDGEFIRGTLESARVHRLACESMDAAALARRAPALRVPPGYVALADADGGFLLAARAIRLFCERALEAGAQVRTGEIVTALRDHGDGIEVTTARGRFTAGHAIVTSGSWTADLLERLRGVLSVTRQTLFWLWPERPALFALDAFPCWAAQIGGAPGLFSGFPLLPASLGTTLGVKVAHHAPGQAATPGALAPAEPHEFEAVRAAVESVFGAALGPVVASKACMYTSSPDQHFIVDRFPDLRAATFACGFSGHGFKFASVIGEVLADLALDGRTRLPIDFLRYARLARA